MELDARPGEPAADSADGASEPPGRLVDGQPLQIAENERQAKRPGEAGDFAVQKLGLLAGHCDGVGGRDRPLEHRFRGRSNRGAAVFVPALAVQPGLGLAGRSEHPIEPASQQVGFSECRRLAGQDEEDGLKGVLGVVPVAQDLATDAQDHRPVHRDQGRESHLLRGVTPGGEPVEELAVGQSGDRAALEERVELPDDRALGKPRHTQGAFAETAVNTRPS